MNRNLLNTCGAALANDSVESSETPDDEIVDDETVTDPTTSQPSMSVVAWTSGALAAVLGTRGAIGAGLAAGLAPGAALLFQRAIDEWHGQQANKAGQVLQNAADEA